MISARMTGLHCLAFSPNGYAVLPIFEVTRISARQKHNQINM